MFTSGQETTDKSRKLEQERVIHRDTATAI